MIEERGAQVGEEALTHLRRWRPRALRVLKGFGIQREDREDVLQELACHFLAGFDEIRHPGSWIEKTTYRLALKRARAARRRYLTEAELTEGEVRTSGRALQPTQEDLVLLTEMLAVLSARSRRALIAYHVYGLSIAELAASYHRSESAVTRLLGRARAKARQLARNGRCERREP